MTEQPSQPLTEEQLASTIYDSICAFQLTAQYASLQHAQMRQHLAEHLAVALSVAGRAPEKEGRSKGIADAAAWLHEVGEREAAYLLRTVDVPTAGEQPAAEGAQR